MSLHSVDSVAVLTLTNKENKQNPAFAAGMLEKLENAIQDTSHSALIITSNDEKNFSQGIDTDWLMGAMQEKRFDEIKSFMYSMDEVFKTLLMYPIPVIAAINGHAFGNGAILSCACDFRFMRSDKGFFCFPEVDLSIPFLPGMSAFIKKAIPPHRFNEMALTGRRAVAADLLEDKVIEQAFQDNESLQEGALEFAATFNKKRAIFGELKRRFHKNIVDTIEIENKPYIENLQLTT